MSAPTIEALSQPLLASAGTRPERHRAKYYAGGLVALCIWVAFFWPARTLVVSTR
jgi:hypothetical protein